MNRIVIVVTAVFLAGCSHTERPETPEAVAQSYVAAVNAKNKSELRALVHPDCLSGLSSLQKEYINDTLTRNFLKAIPQEHTVSVSSLESDTMPFADMLVWRVKPTHQIQIDYSKGEYSSVTIIRDLKKTEDGWCIVMPLPNDKNLKQYKEKKESQQD